MEEDKKYFWPAFGLEPGSINVMGSSAATSAPQEVQMPKDMRNIPQGTILNVSMGSYSDYYVADTYKVLKEIDPNLLLRGWLEKYPEQKNRYKFDSQKFRAWLEDTGFLKKIETLEWHMEDGYDGYSGMVVWDGIR